MYKFKICDTLFVKVKLFIYFLLFFLLRKVCQIFNIQTKDCFFLLPFLIYNVILFVCFAVAVCDRVFIYELCALACYWWCVSALVVIGTHYVGAPLPLHMHCVFQQQLHFSALIIYSNKLGNVGDAIHLKAINILAFYYRRNLNKFNLNL